MATTNDGNVKRYSEKSFPVKNKSVSRELGNTGDGEGVARSKNRGSQNIEAKATGNVRRASGGSQYNPYGVAGSRNRGQYRGDVGTDHGVDVPSGKNKGAAPDHPDVKIASGKTKVHTYPAGRNRGRNYKG